MRSFGTEWSLRKTETSTAILRLERKRIRQRHSVAALHKDAFTALAWEVDWVLKFLSDPNVEALEDPTNAPEDISGQESEAVSQSDNTEGSSP